jgi:hypothetical protein
MTERLSFGAIILCGGKLLGLISVCLIPQFLALTVESRRSHNFPIGKLAAIYSHVLEHCPRVVDIYKKVDPVVRSIMEGESNLPDLEIDSISNEIEIIFRVQTDSAASELETGKMHFLHTETKDANCK